MPVDPKAKTFRREPFLLEKRKTVSAAKGAALRVWLTLKIPESAAAADYTGTITVQVARRASAEIKLVAKVLPLALPPAPVEMAMFFPSPADSDELLMKQLIDAREHGCNGIEPAMSVVIKTRDRDFGEDDVAATRAQCKRLMEAERKVFGPRAFPVTFELGHEIAYFWDHQKAWFSFWPHSKKIDHDFLRAVDVVCEMAKEEGWPPLRAYALDEAGAHNLLDEAVYYYGLIKKHRPELTTWTDIGGGIAMGIDEIGPLSASIDVFNTNRFTPEIAKTLVGRKKPYAVYNGCGPTPAGARFFFGFYGYKTGASQIAQWAYYSGNALFQGNGFRQDDEGYVYLAEDGPLPSVMWEAVREGITDYRYLSLLRDRSPRPGRRTGPGRKRPPPRPTACSAACWAGSAGDSKPWTAATAPRRPTPRCCGNGDGKSPSRSSISSRFSTTVWPSRASPVYRPWNSPGPSRPRNRPSMDPSCCRPPVSRRP